MKIIDKMKKIETAVGLDPDGNATLGDFMKKYSCLAVQQGINSRAWKEYMRVFASNPSQLQRLIGEDQDYNETIYGPTTLAYLVANGCCGITTTAKTGRDMTPEMLEGIDSGDLDDSDHASFV